MITDYQTSWVRRFLKVVLVVAPLSFSNAHALVQPNIESMQADSITQKDKGQQTPPSASCTAYFKESNNAINCRAGEVPLPAARWLFLLALIGFVGLSNKRKI